MYKKIIGLTTTLLILTSCIGGSNNNNSPTSNNTHQTLPLTKLNPAESNNNPESTTMLTDIKYPTESTINDGEKPSYPGYGFDSRTQVSKGLSCLVNANEINSITLFNPEGILNFGSNVSTDHIANLFNVNDHSSGLFSTSAPDIYIRDITDSRQTLNFNYFYTVTRDATFKLKGFGNRMLSKEAQNLLNSGVTNFTTVCGDSIIHGAKMGATLAVTVAIQFPSAEEKDKFEESHRTSNIEIGAISENYMAGANNSTKNAIISIRAFQLGAKPELLSQVFNNKEPDQQYNVIRCQHDNVNLCKNIINNLIGYAQHGFQDKIDFNNLSTLYTYQLITYKYDHFAVHASLPNLTSDTQDAAEYLTTSVKYDKEMLNYLITYRKQTFYYNQVDYTSKQLINKAIQDYNSILSAYNQYSAVDTCYNDTKNVNTKCIATANEIKSIHNKYINSITLANNLASVAAANTPVGTIFFTPIHAFTESTTFGNPLNSLYGKFIAYNPRENTFSSTCYIDTTIDHSYFKKFYPEFGDKTVKCFGQYKEGINDFYIYGYGDRRQFGNAGHIVNGAESSYPVPSSGNNVQFSYSDGTDFTYNPI